MVKATGPSRPAVPAPVRRLKQLHDDLLMWGNTARVELEEAGHPDDDLNDGVCVLCSDPGAITCMVCRIANHDVCCNKATDVALHNNLMKPFVLIQPFHQMMCTMKFVTTVGRRTCETNCAKIQCCRKHFMNIGQRSHDMSLHGPFSFDACLISLFTLPLYGPFNS